MTTTQGKIINDSTQVSDNFDILLVYIQKKRTVPPVFKHDGTDVSILFRHSINSLLKQSIYDLFYKEFNCIMCARNAKRYCVYSANGIPLLADRNLLPQMASNPKLTDFYNKLCGFGDMILASPIVNVVTLSSDIFAKRMGVIECGGFPHIVPNIQILMSEKSSKFYQSAFDRYLRTPLLNRLISQLLDQEGGIDGAIKSLNLMDVCCKEALYGDTFIGTVWWLRDFLTKIKEKYGGTHINKLDQNIRWTLLVELLLSGKINKDLRGSVCTSFHQANGNVIDLMGAAISKEAMVKMITERMKPTKYLRRDPTKVLSPQVIQLAINCLGDFVNRLMTHDDVSKLPNAVTLIDHTKLSLEKSLVSSKTGFESMMKETVSKTKKGFAERSNLTSDISEISNIITMYDMIEYMRKNPTAQVSIDVIKMSTWMKLVHSTLAGQTDTEGDTKIQIPYMWVFEPSNDISLSSLNRFPTPDHFQPVTHIVPTIHHSWKTVFFGLSVIPKANIVVTGNCCFPEFLTSKYMRVAGPAFEKLNSTTKLDIPDVPLSQMALGVGTCSGNRDGRLSPSITLKINGIVKVITHLGDMK
jgi:hypothetical protein